MNENRKNADIALRNTRCVDKWGNCGTILSWSKPIMLTCPYEGFDRVGGYWWIRRDRDGAKVGTHPKMLTFCRECPKNCPKK